MSVVDLHPENLLDKEIRGELDGAERLRLEAHLAQCPTCRLERELRADFQLELSRESVPPEIAGLVERLAHPEAGPTPPPVAVVAPSRGRARRVKLILVAVAATLTLVAGAFASTEVGHRAIAPLLGRTASTAREAEVATAAPRPVRHVPATAPRPVASTPEPEPTVVESASATPPTTTAPPVVAPSPPPAVNTPPVPEGPGPLFGEEADARRRGDSARMLEIHAQLVARFPQSHEAQVSRMMVARMLLDRGDAGGALSGFDAYLRGGSGELREDALAGRATALDRLGRTDEGRRAWMALLDQYPNTAYGAHARSRVEAPGER